MGSACACFNVSDQTTIIIEKKMQLLSNQDSITHKILMLGSGESGKSTFFKQLGWLYGRNDKDKELTLQDKQEALQPIRQNIIEGIITLLDRSDKLRHMDRFENIDLYVDVNDVNIKEKIKYIVQFQDEQFDKDCNKTKEQIKKVGLYVADMWDLKPIKNTYKLRSYFSFSDNIDYFFNKCVDVFEPDYIPSHEDVLKSRARTTGVLNIIIDVVPKEDQGLSSESKINSFELIDVGGQRSERNKWISHFKDVKAILFVAALNHYATVIFEDENQNAMHESLGVFDKYINMDCFQETEIILFLNKDDLFRQKIREGIHLDICFKNHPNWKPVESKENDTNEVPYAQWTGLNEHGKDVNYVPNQLDDVKDDDEWFEDCWDAAKNFIALEYEKRFFRTRINDDTTTLYTHVTTATNQSNVQSIFWDVQNTIVKANLKDGGLIY